MVSEKISASAKKKFVSGKKRDKVRQNKTIAHRHKIGHNETLMLPKPPEDFPEIPDLKLPEQKKGKRLFKGLFGFGKKEKAEESKKEKVESDKEFVKPLEIPEPEFLREIDLGHVERVEPELALWLNDGRVVKNLEELAKAFKTMTSRVFHQHREKNDISQWVRDVIGNAQLASELAIAKTKRDAAKIMEKHGKKKKMPVVAIENEKQLEIQKAIEDISYKTESKTNPLKEREKALEEKERLLELEEEHINKRRIELANKRYGLIKERGEIEKEKFEEILKGHGKFEEVPHDNAGMPKFELTSQYSKEKIEGLIDETRRAIDQGQTEEAKHFVDELKTALEFTEISPKESKKLEYDVLELEADIKLSTLV